MVVCASQHADGASGSLVMAGTHALLNTLVVVLAVRLGAGADGSLDADEDPAQLAFEIDAFLLMANSAFLLHDDAAALRRARALATRLGMARRA